MYLFEAKTNVNIKNLSSFQRGVQAFQKGSFLEAEKHFLEHIKLHPQSYNAFYNLGVLYRINKKPIQSIASFRRALLSSSFFNKTILTKNHLDQLNASPSFFILIPEEIFYIALSTFLILLLFSFTKWKLGLLVIISLMSGFFFYLKNKPRSTILQSTVARSAPNEKASPVLNLSPGTWVIEIPSQNQKWVQIKSKNQGAGWVLRDLLF